jgi:hypothetical protein
VGLPTLICVIQTQNKHKNINQSVNESKNHSTRTYISIGQSKSIHDHGSFCHLWLCKFKKSKPFGFPRRLGAKVTTSHFAKRRKECNNVGFFQIIIQRPATGEMIYSEKKQPVYPSNQSINRGLPNIDPTVHSGWRPDQSGQFGL